jgi:lactoylglutathione lyase
MKRIIAIILLLSAFSSDMLSQSPIFDHAAIYVTDIKKSTLFYRDVVGLDTIANPFRDDMHVWFNMGGGTELHVIAGATSVKEHYQDVHLSFKVSSIDQFIQKLVKANVPYVNARNKQGEVTTRPDGVKQIYFKDPDGYWIEINDAPKR